MNDRPIIAMVHYHLRRGGVTRVMQSALAALKDAPVQCIVLTGEPPRDDMAMDAPVAVVNGLGYDENGDHVFAETLIEKTKQAVREAIGSVPDIWHIHNHALGKNAAWTHAVSMLVESGERVLLHIHDFAEDGRPDNYRYLAEQLRDVNAGNMERTLYPQRARTHYALLNRRDRGFMMNAGVPEKRAHLLPNAVWTGGQEQEIPDACDTDRPLYLYPTRAIRRKNIGEFLLWSAMDEGNGRYGITLAPQSSGEVPFYERWQTFAWQQDLPVEFELGLKHDYHALLASASALVTTSMAEGFGLAFLESWLMNRSLAGRNLLEITAEFVEEGIDLAGLYDTLTVPLEWIGEEAFRNAIADRLQHSRRAYGRDTAEEDVAHAVRAAVAGDRIEFGRLDEAFQEIVIRRVRTSRLARSEINPSRLIRINNATAQIQANRRCIETRYGLTQYRERLMGIYTDMLNAADEDATTLAPNAVLDQFLSPARYALLRS